MSEWGKARLGAVPDNGDRRTLMCEAESLSLPATMFHPIQEDPAVAVDNGGPLGMRSHHCDAGGSSVWNARSARAVVGARRRRGEPAAGRRRTVGAGHYGIDLDFGYLTAGCHRPAPGRDEAGAAQGAETQTLGVYGRGRGRLFQRNVGSRVGAGSGDRDCTAARRR